MTIIIESADMYHSRPAVSASLLWDITRECPAYGYARSVFCPEPVTAENNRHFDVGTAAHLAVLEPTEVAERVIEVQADNWRTKQAQEYRDMAYYNGKIPLLSKDVALIDRLRAAIKASPAGEWFANAVCERTVVWDWLIRVEEPAKGSPPDIISHRTWRVDCKMRVDAVPTEGPMLDLKTAPTAGPEAFQRACVRDGHHLRAAWYMDGWLASEGEKRDYVFVVVAKSEPHLVQCYTLDERAIEYGRRLYRRATAEVRLGLETGVWRGYDEAGEKVTCVSLPNYAEYRLAELFAEEDSN